MNDVAYKLLLPEHAQVHPVFHVSQLRRALHSCTPVEPNLPLCADDLVVPVEVLQSHCSVIEQVQVRYSGATIITWEDKEALRTGFPHAAAWG